MTFRPHLRTRIRRDVFALALTCAATVPAHAIDTDPGDWSAPPAGTNLLLVYAQHASRDTLFTQGQSTTNATLDSEVVILRYVRPVEVSGLVIAPQVLLPAARLQAGGVVSALGSASGLGDLILASPVWFARSDAANRNSLAVAPYLVLPTGRYVKGQPLNIGEHRWKVILQTGGTRQLAPSLDLEGAADVTVYGRNTAAGTGGDTLAQQPQFQLQGSLNWHQAPGRLLAVGLSHTAGGQQKLNGESQDNRMATTKVALTASTFVAPTVQLLGSVGRDLKVENGFKESARINLRLLTLF